MSSTREELMNVSREEFVTAYVKGPHYEDVAQIFGATVGWVKARRNSYRNVDNIILKDLPRKSRRKPMTEDERKRINKLIADATTQPSDQTTNETEDDEISVEETRKRKDKLIADTVKASKSHKSKK